MKISKILEIENEAIRFMEKLRQAKERAMSNSTQYNYEKKINEVIDWDKRECLNTKEAASLKRSALDMKRILSNL